MSAIPFTSGNYRSRVDGTLVLSVEIEPAHRNDALKLFGSPGTSGALAALKDGHAKKSDAPPAEPVGPLCKWAVMRCGESMFRSWLSLKTGEPMPDEAAAKAMICMDCDIQSRRELDTNKVAAMVFDELYRKPYAQWLKSQGGTFSAEG